MREIKFRAWDRIEKRIVPPSEFYKQEWGGEDEYDIRVHRILIEATGTVLVWDDLHGFCEPTVSPGGNRFELMQFTGLKDKNGKEIYEGDILSNWYFGEERAVVIFHLGSFKAEPQCFSDGLLFRTYDQFDKEEQTESLNSYIVKWKGSEVIGNIYEEEDKT